VYTSVVDPTLSLPYPEKRIRRTGEGKMGFLLLIGEDQGEVCIL